MKRNIEVYEKEPEGFSSKVEVAACYVEIDGELLLLQLSESKSEAGKWGVPAGKIERGELPIDAAARELFEETGIRIDSPDRIQPLGSLYIRKSEIDYVYHLFRVQIDHVPTILLSSEHQNYRWTPLKNLNEGILMVGAGQALEYYRKMVRRLGSTSFS